MSKTNRLPHCHQLKLRTKLSNNAHCNYGAETRTPRWEMVVISNYHCRFWHFIYLANSRFSFLPPSVFQDLETASHQQFSLTSCRIHSTPAEGCSLAPQSCNSLGSHWPWDEVAPQLTFWSLTLFPHLFHHPEYSLLRHAFRGSSLQCPED